MTEASNEMTAELLATVKALQAQLNKQSLELELSLEREKVMKEQQQFTDKEAAQVELMAQLKTLHKKVEQQEVKLEESFQREGVLREELDEQKKINEELREEIKMKDEIIMDLKERLCAYE